MAEGFPKTLVEATIKAVKKNKSGHDASQNRFSAKCWFAIRMKIPKLVDGRTQIYCQSERSHYFSD